ncbi:VspD [Vibrio aestuarianus]|uniref:VspD n=1 Tax=Vibrio aestuarianus TaxID=28171 RepID=UPI00237CFB68|nr:VspD [Vibrio aestuarianus]MDE1336227.1 VspD [Vibrio aestuarianus]
MNQFMINISAATYNTEVEQENRNAQQVEATRSQSEVPKQPLPSSSISLSMLWRMIQEEMKKVANAISGTGVENSETKKSLIELQKQSQVTMLNERLEELEKQRKAEKKKSFWGKIGMAFGFVAAIVMAPFNPVMAGIMIGVMIASIVVPKIADKIMIAAGVPEKTRTWVKMGLELAIGLLGAVLSFNPGNFAAAVSKAAANAAAKAAQLADKAADIINSIKSFASISTKVQSVVHKMMKMIQPLLDKIKEFAKGGQLVAARIGQASSVSSEITSIVTTGYSLKSAAITRDLEKAEANQEELETRIEQILLMLDQALRAINHAFESLAKVNNDKRDFDRDIMSIHM